MISKDSEDLQNVSRDYTRVADDIKRLQDYILVEDDIKRLLTSER